MTYQTHKKQSPQYNHSINNQRANKMLKSRLCRDNDVADYLIL